MNTQVTQYFITQGPFAVLFLMLLWWVLKEGAKREDRLITSLDKITDRLNGMGEQVTVLTHDVSEIKELVGGR